MQADLTPSEILRRMDAAFVSVPYPGDDQLLARDCPAGRRLRDGLRGRPPGAVPEKLVEQYYDGLAMLSPEARRYYLSAWVRVAMRRPGSDVAEFVLYTLGGDLPWQLTGGFTSGERAAVVAFLGYLPSLLGGVFAGLIDDALARWRAVVPVRQFDWTGGRITGAAKFPPRRGAVPELPTHYEHLELPVHPEQLERLETNSGIFPAFKRIFA